MTQHEYRDLLPVIVETTDADLQDEGLQDEDPRGSVLRYANLQCVDLRYANLQDSTIAAY